MRPKNVWEFRSNFALITETVVDLYEKLERYIDLALIADQKGICNPKLRLQLGLVKF